LALSYKKAGSAAVFRGVGAVIVGNEIGLFQQEQIWYNRQVDPGSGPE
jgi:hypothetical protein